MEVVTELQRLLDQYHLAEYYREFMFARHRLAAGRLSKALVKRYLQRARDLAVELERVPRHKFRVPTEDQLHAAGRPPITIGHVQGRPELRVGPNLHDRSGAILVAGAAGTGKTVLTCRLSTAFAEFPQFLIDEKSDSFAHLRTVLPASIWITLDDTPCFGLNPPRGVSSRTWIGVLAECFAANAGLLASKAVLAEVLAWLVESLNPEGGHELWPDIQLIVDVLSAASYAFAKKDDYTKSLLQKLVEAARALGPVARTFRGLDVDDLTRSQRVILGVKSLQPLWVRAFVTDLLKLQIFHGRMARGVRTNQTEVLIAHDEADWVASRAINAQHGGSSPTGRLLEQGRELGISPIIGVHAIGNVSADILTNTTTTIIFSLADADSLREVDRMLMLEGGARCCPSLSPGQAIYRETRSSWPEPTLIQVDNYSMNADGVPPAVDVLLGIIPARPLGELPQVRQRLKQLRDRNRIETAAAVAAPAPEEIRAPVELSKNAVAALEAWAADPWRPIARIWEQLGIEKATKAHELIFGELLELKFIELKEARIGRATNAFMEPTVAGWEFLKSTLRGKRGRGGIVHCSIAHAICAIERRRGHDAEVEFVVPGTTHAADVGVQRVTGEIFLYEVVDEASDNLDHHLVAAFLASTAVTSVTIVTLQRKFQPALQKKLAADPLIAPLLDRVQWAEADKFILRRRS